VDSCDILAPNPYPIRHLEPQQNDLRLVGTMVDAARQAAESRPVWAIIQAFWTAPIWPRNPTPAELRAMIFIALNHGADGVIYFSYKSGNRAITDHAELFEIITRVNGQLRALRGALLVKPEEVSVGLNVTEEEREAAIETPAEHEAQPLDCSLRPFRNAHLFIAVNPDPWPKQVEVSLPASGAGKEATELFTGETAEPMPLSADNAWSLAFEPYQVRLFWLE